MLPKPVQRSRSHLRLAVSRPAEPVARPSPELRRAVAATVAAQFRGLWVPAEMGPAGILYMLRHHTRNDRGFRHPDDVDAIVREAIEIMADLEATASAAFRLPPRRRQPPRAPQGMQLALRFKDAA